MHKPTIASSQGSSFAPDRVVCTRRLPSRARGKRLSGSVEVTLQGARAKRNFSVTVH